MTSIKLISFVLLLAAVSCKQSPKEFKKLRSINISGQYILKDSKFAGFNFISPTLISWTNEMDEGHPDTMKLRWLDSITFFVKDIERHAKNCPPRIWIYKIISFDEKHLVLTDVNTTWVETDDENLEFTKDTISK